MKRPMWQATVAGGCPSYTAAGDDSENKGCLLSTLGLSRPLPNRLHPGHRVLSNLSPHQAEQSPLTTPPPAGIQTELVRTRGRPSGAAFYPFPSQRTVPTCRRHVAARLRFTRPPLPVRAPGGRLFGSAAPSLGTTDHRRDRCGGSSLRRCTGNTNRSPNRNVCLSTLGLGRAPGALLRGVV